MADYYISKLSLNGAYMIDNVLVYENLGKLLGPKTTQGRDWMVSAVKRGKTFSSMTKTEQGKWKDIGALDFDGSIFSWYKVPKNITRRKTFISYYHYEDQYYKNKFMHLFEDLIIGKSVNDGDIDSDNSDDYIKKLIQNNHLEDTTVLIVLIGANTKHRKHIDWEISGALDLRVGEKYAAVLGIILPTHPDYGKTIYYKNLPDRLSANIQSGYAVITHWTDERIEMQDLIELAYSKRIHIEAITNRAIPQMTKNTNE